MKKIIFSLLIISTLVSCQKENNDLVANANETIYVDNAGASMRVNIRGNIASKVIMIVVHGGPGGASYFYRTDAAKEKLETKYATAYWDQRVAGASQGGSNKENMVMEQYGKDLKAVIQVLKHKYGQDLKVFLMGQSWGGMVCAQFMTEGNNQDMVNGWISANATHNWAKNDVLSRNKLLTFGKEQIALGKNVARWQVIVDYCTANSGAITAAISAKLNGYAYDALTLIEGFTPFDEDSVIKATLISDKIPFTNSFLNLANPNTCTLIESLQNIEFSSKLNKITKPVLVLSGKYDFVIPSEMGDELYEKVSSRVKTRKIFQKTGHNLEEQEGYVDAFVAFMDANK
jgi:pimeloyl-ACP methyl ester carboxylesterase